ncbi:MAG: ATP-binding protein [Candidatus Woesebacteria bacterium]|jgi:predicted AAA+ superfamily ATPase
MKKRRIWPILKKEINTDEIIVITGSRQVGKTTTLKWLLKQIPSNNKHYFDLENLRDKELFEVKDYNSLINEFQNIGLKLDQKLYLTLDEIQALSNLPSVVKYLYDHYQIKFFLTGSSSYYIKNKFNESMAGRKINYEMLPLSFQEFLDFQGVDYSLYEDPWVIKFLDPTFQKLNTYYREYIEYGGLPKVVLTSSVDRKKKLLEEIFSSYIRLDVKNLADFKSISDLRRVINLLAARIGNKLNVTEIANITGLNRITIANYIEFLEQTYLIRTIPAYSKSIDIKSRLQKKVYFVDTGIANVNADLSSGSKFENTVCHQLFFWDGNLSYFSNRDGEIDFILENEKEKGAFEVKETPTQRNFTALKRRAERLGIQNYRIIGKERSANFSDFLWGGQIK